MVKIKFDRFLLPDTTVTVGWLIDEVKTRYEKLYDDGDEIIGLKSFEDNPTLDYYLTQLDNTCDKLHNLRLTVFYFNPKFANSPMLKSKVGKEDFEFLRVIGHGGYSHVVLARK